jgi:hypothetical protein
LDEPQFSQGTVSQQTSVEPLLALPHFALMDREREKSAINEKLARCKQLAKENFSEPTAAHLRELEAELLAQLRRLEEQ